MQVLKIHHEVSVICEVELLRFYLIHDLLLGKLERRTAELYALLTQAVTNFNGVIKGLARGSSTKEASGEGVSSSVRIDNGLRGQS